MSDKETPDPNEPVPMTRTDHKRLWFHYEKIDAMSDSQAELWKGYHLQREKVEKLEKRCDNLKEGIRVLFVIVAVLALHAMGYID